MITLNLLSPAQKEALRSRVIFAMIERLMIVLVCVLMTCSVLLLFIKLQLTQNLEGVQLRQVLTSDYAKANSDIRQLNQQLTRVDALQKLELSPSSLLRDLAERTPPGVTVQALDFDVKSASMRLGGVAAHREDLLAFETAMKQSPFVKSLDSPISNLFQKTGINFHFDIVLNVAALSAPLAPKP